MGNSKRNNVFAITFYSVAIEYTGAYNGFFDTLTWLEQSETNNNLRALQNEIEHFRAVQSSQAESSFSDAIVELYDLIVQEVYVEEALKKRLRNQIYSRYLQRANTDYYITEPSISSMVFNVVISLVIALMVYANIVNLWFNVYGYLLVLVLAISLLFLLANTNEYKLMRWNRTQEIENLARAKRIAQEMKQQFSMVTAYGLYVKATIDSELEQIVVSNQRFDVLRDIYDILELSKTVPMTFDYDKPFVENMTKEIIEAFNNA